MVWLLSTCLFPFEGYKGMGIHMLLPFEGYKGIVINTSCMFTCFMACQDHLWSQQSSWGQLLISVDINNNKELVLNDIPYNFTLSQTGEFSVKLMACIAICLSPLKGRRVWSSNASSILKGTRVWSPICSSPLKGTRV